MSDSQAAPAPDLRALTDAYLKAFESRDLEGCLGFFHDDASIDFQDTVYRGRPAVESWHRDRFDANLHMLRLDAITVNGNVVTIDGVAASNRLAAWKIKGLNGRITIRFEGDKIKEGKLVARMTNLFDMLRGE
jgi:hypothetical protein